MSRTFNRESARWGMNSITVVTPSLPVRGELLGEAMESVVRQQLLPESHLVMVDHALVGPEVLRWRGLIAAATDWVAFLDDDDVWGPEHLLHLLRQAKKEWDEGRQVPLFYSLSDKGKTGWSGVLVYRATGLQVGGAIPGLTENLVDFLVELRSMGHKHFALEELTWTKRYHPGQTSEKKALVEMRQRRVDLST